VSALGVTLPPTWRAIGARRSTDMVTVHDPDYRAALQDFITFTEKVSEKVVEADELIPELPVKDVVSNNASSLLPRAES
jgi:hypothetical protein